jgi:hypothetical protein
VVVYLSLPLPEAAVRVFRQQPPTIREPAVGIFAIPQRAMPIQQVEMLDDAEK